MFDFTRKETKVNKRKIKNISVLSFLALSLIINAQTKEQANDLALLDSFIQSKGYSSTIAFSSSNIKQFWIDKSVVSQDNLIKILIDDTKSVPCKIQLANINEMHDCNVDIISKRPDLKFSVLNSDLKVISNSKKQNDFINYNIVSASFHLEDTNSLSFYLQFSSSQIKDEFDIHKIIISFSDNKESSFLASPGKLFITGFNCTIRNGKRMEGDNSFSVTGRSINIISKNKIYVSDNTLSSSVTVKNIGDTQTQILLGYIPYTKDGKIINMCNNPYKSGKILRVVSAEKGRNTITVDSEPEWTKGCYLALDAKEDLSDFPNHSWVDGTIQDVKKNDDNHFEILFSQPNQKEIKAGTPVRIQSPVGNTYLYTNNVKLLPGEEINLSSDITKDNSYLECGTEKLCRGTYYVVPILLSFSVGTKNENTVQITDYTVSY